MQIAMMQMMLLTVLGGIWILIYGELAAEITMCVLHVMQIGKWGGGVKLCPGFILESR